MTEVERVWCGVKRVSEGVLGCASVWVRTVACASERVGKWSGERRREYASERASWRVGEYVREWAGWWVSE